MQYITDQVPAAVAGSFMPHLTRDPYSSSYGVVVVRGAPGTMPVAAPRPAATAGLTSLDPHTQPSAVAPDMILPAIYTVGQRNRYGQEHVPVSLLRDNELPVPARGLYALPGVAFVPPHVGGRRQVGQPRVSTRWPWMNRSRHG